MKNNDFLTKIILKAVQVLNGERSLAGFRNILVGKRNHQTWLDVHLLNMCPFYHFFNNEEIHFLERIMNELNDRSLIEPIEGDRIILTSRGIDFLNNDPNPYHRDGRILNEMYRFWDRLHLLIQSLSNLLQKKSSFLPVVRDEEIQAQVKNWLHSMDRMDFAKGIRSDFEMILSDLLPIHRDIALLRLTGSHRIALTLTQLSQKLNMSYWEIKWEWECMLTDIYTKLLQNQFTYLSLLINKKNFLLSNSTQQTLALIQQNKNVAEISSIRSLKESTIYDHIIEIAMVTPHFPTSQFIQEHELLSVEQMMKKLNSTKLKLYKEYLPHLSYFQIRLALLLLGKGVHHEFSHFS